MDVVARYFTVMKSYKFREVLTPEEVFVLGGGIVLFWMSGHVSSTTLLLLIGESSTTITCSSTYVVGLVNPLPTFDHSVVNGKRALI